MPKRKGKDSSGGGGKRHDSGLLAADKSLGQNFLKNPAIVDAIVDRAQLRATHAARLTKNNELLVVSEAHRTQRLNAADALARLQAFVDAAASAAAPRATRPDKARRIKGLAKGAERKRQDGKRRASAKKGARGRVSKDDF